MICTFEQKGVGGWGGGGSAERTALQSSAIVTVYTISQHMSQPYHY